MLRPLFILGFALFLSSALTRAEIELHPRYVAIDVGGAIIRRAYFAEGNKNYAVTIDAETEVLDGTGGAVFRFKSVEGAEVSLRPSPLTVAVPFTLEKLPEYLKSARMLLGNSAIITKETPALLDVFPINGWTSCRYTFQYQVAGISYESDVTFLNISEKQQVVMVTGAKEKDFEQVRARADKLMKRWHEVLPGDEQGQN